MELFKPGDSAQEAYIIERGVDEVGCRIRLQEEGKQELFLTDGDMVGANALTFEAMHSTRKNRATVLTSGELMLLRREAIIHVHNAFPVARLKQHVEKFINYRNQQKERPQALSSKPAAGQSGWEAWQHSEEHRDTRTAAERLTQIEADVHEIKTMLRTLVQK